MTVTEQPPTSPPAQRGGAGRRRPPRTPKGRQVDPQALEEVLALLTDRPRRRDLLIEHLHLIQDHYGHLSAAHLAALAQEMKLALTEVYEVATFYAHFDVVKEGQTPPPPVTVRVCDSLSCALAGAERLLAELPKKLGRECARGARAVHGRLRPRAGLRRRPCAGDAGRRGEGCCRRGEARACACLSDADTAFDAYVRGGGYELLKACIGGTRTRDDIIKAVSDAGLRGLGGAGFPTGRKWSLVRAEPAPRLFAVNADEGEPGTFKDRYYLEQRSAPLHRRHADRRLDRRGRRHVSLYPRRISGSAAAAHRRNRQGRSARACRSTPRFICAAAPALTSAAKNRR